MRHNFSQVLPKVILFKLKLKIINFKAQMLSFTKTKYSNKDSRFNSTSQNKVPGRNLSSQQLDLLYNLHCQEINEKYSQKLLSKNPKKNLERERYIELKRCEICRDFVHDSKLLLCDICEDAYHFYCLSPKLKKIPNEFFCVHCNKEISKNRQTCLEESFTVSVKKFKKVCQKCTIARFRRSILKFVTKCKKVYHDKCFKEPTASKSKKIVCGDCESFIQKQNPRDEDRGLLQISKKW